LRRLWQLFVPVGALVLVSSLLAAATTAAPNRAAPSGYPALQAVGEEIPFLDQGGKEIGVISAVEVTDPFTDYDSFFPPAAGFRFVAVEIAASATEGRFNLNPAQVRVQTANGFLYYNDFIFRDADSDAPADLRLTGLAPGDEAGGLVIFTVPEGDEPSLILWQPNRNRLLVLADLSGA
jgi:hypothetical protein